MSYPRFFAQYGERLIDNGYPIIPILPGEKRPRYDAWQTQPLLTKDAARAMGLNGSMHDGIGVQTAYAPAVDIDIYDEATANVMSDWVDQHIGMGLMREGQAPKRLLLFRTDKPFSKTFSALYKIPGTTQGSKVEILGAGQQFVAYGVHPDTQKPYLWPDESILDRNYWSLPVLTHDAAIAICQAFEAYADAQGWEKLKRGNWNASHTTTYSDDPLDRKTPRQDVTEEQIRDALALLDPDEYSSYESWVRVGQMLHHQFQGAPEGLELYDEWSATLDKYEGYEAVEAKWASFNEVRNAGVVTIGSLLHEARQIRERAAAQEEETRKGMEAFLFRELEVEVAGFNGDWFDFKSGDTVAAIRRFIGNVTDQADAERYLSKIGKTVADRKFDGAPAKASIEKELKPSYRKAGAAPHAVALPSGGAEHVQYETNRDGAILPSQTNVVLAMRSGGWAHIGYDRFQGQIKVCLNGSNDWRNLDDNDYPRALVFLEANGFTNVSKEKIKDAVGLVAEERSFDSAILWGNSLQWDGVARLPNFSSRYLGLPDTEYHVAVWYYAFTAMAARLFEPGCKADMVPVLVSEEGFNKSSFVEALAPIAESFGLLDLSKKDDDISRNMRGKLVMEWAEMKGLKGRDEEAIKQFVTQAFQEWTPKYREFDTRFYRRCFFIGTANNPDLLPAHGKNRRWLPMTLTHAIDLDAVRRDREQLWAEAILVYRNYGGIAWQRAHELAGVEREAYREDDPLSELIGDWLDSANFEGGADGSVKRGDAGFRMSDLTTSLERAGHKGATSQRVGTRLRAMGYVNTLIRKGHTFERLWIRKS